jgi:hypothetical protein
MVKQSINIVGIQTLYNILQEIRNNLSFDLINFQTKNDFLKSIDKINLINQSSLIFTKISNKEFFLNNTKIKKKNFFFISNNLNEENNSEFNIIQTPINIYLLLEKINIQLIKQKYNYQSKISVNRYELDLNSRIIYNNNNKLKLTEKEMDIILFLNENKNPQKIDILQSKVWGYSSDLETHTVETHIYRLRKKIKDNFDDNNFILSTDEGYLIG